MIRRPPRSTHCISSAASDVYKRQELDLLTNEFNIKWSWVKAHSTDKLNNEVDLIAREAASSK